MRPRPRAHRDGWARALITGASEGIGEAFARELASFGTDLVLVARRADRLGQLAGELGEVHGVSAETLAADLTRPPDVARVEARLDRGERSVDLLVNNVGSETEHAPFLRRDRELLADELQLNVAVLLRLTHAFASSRSAAGGGNVINVSAGNAFYPTPGSAAYGASKAFVNSLTEALAYELRAHGIGVTAVCPGFTRTGAQARLGLKTEAVPDALWSEPRDIVTAALRAAGRGKTLTSVTAKDALGAFVGRNLPRRLMLPIVARATGT